ncbi:uncharacterized protein LOC117100801, partial [Anneissia japonica]|uniref:uncharacterized protein LOC117100801 n=1 Tax=Anneissia japonica TaxID=1529436 RepID=UPI001425A7B1
MASHLEVEKLIEIGKEFGLSGKELRVFVDEERQKLNEQRDVERALRAEMREDEKRRKEIDLEIELDKKRVEADIDLKKEAEKVKILQLQLQLEQAKAAHQVAANDTIISSSKGKPPKLPPFNPEKDDIDAYISRFERYATTQGWKRDQEWATNLGALLQGTALFEYSLLPPDEINNYDKVKQEHAIFLRERKPKDSITMASFSNQYLEARGFWKGTQPVHFERGKCSSMSSYDGPGVSFKDNGPRDSRPRETYRRGGPVTYAPRRCYICNRVGHVARDCYRKKNISAGMIGKREADPMGKGKWVSSIENTYSDVYKKPNDLPVATKLVSCEGDDNKMPIQTGYIGKYEVQVLRDSGCTNVVVNSAYVESAQYTGEEKVVMLIDGTVKSFPVALIDVDTPFLVGSVQAVVMEGAVCDLIIGNVQGARDANDPNKEWRKKQEITAAVMTRSQAKANEVKKVSKLKVVSPIDEVTPEDLITKQKSDPTLCKPRELAGTGKYKDRGCGEFEYVYDDKGILFREFTSPKVELGNIIRQVVVPKCFRNHVLRIAHESIVGGHMGSKKTYDKILTCFFWPGMQGDVRRYCQSCDICQRTVPKGRVTKVPLGSMPVIGEPFQRVGIDLVGPIKPITTRGHKFILVLVDYSTRYPEAVPLKNIETVTIAEALISIYSRLGFPNEVLSDQGSQFTSKLMSEVNRLLSIKSFTTTPYHAMCNGLVEKFNGTLKGMLKKMCEEKPKDWDRYIDPLLFAYREVPQESTGFSPFELLYGRSVRGPMMIIKELWTGSRTHCEQKPAYNYVLDLKDRLEHTCKIAKNELHKASKRYKKYYDKKAKPRELEIGNEVLVLLPTDSNKLLMSWKGPFPISQK